MQVDTLAALGGYLSNFAPSIPGNSYPQTITGLYRTPNLHLRVRGVYTNTVPVDAYRGSGRPEATWINERLIERGAHELGIDVVEIRRRNLIARADFPYPAPGGRVYDSGDPPALLEKLLSLADYPALRRRQAELRRQGILMGIGLACFIDKAGTGPSANLAKRGGLHGGWESAIVRVHSDGKVTVFAGSRIRTAKATTSPSRRSPRTGSASISTISAWSRATPTGFRSATAPGARVPHRSPAPRFCARPIRSSPRRAASPPKRSNARATMSSTGMGVSASAAPIAPSALPKLPISPITAPNCRLMVRSNPASKSPSSTIRPTPTIPRPCTLPS